MGSGATKEKTNSLNQIEQNQSSLTQIGQNDGSPQIFTLKNNTQLSKAFSLLKKQQFQEAIIILDIIIEKNPNLADAQYLKGLAYLGLNDLSNALCYCKAATDIDKKHTNALAEIGNIYTLERKYEEALIIFHQLIELNEKSFEGNFGIGFINLLLNNFEIAEPYFQNALKIKSKDKAALLNYGHLLIKQQKFDESLQYYEQALKEDPKYSDAINAITNVYLRQKKYDQLFEFLDNLGDQKISKVKSVILNCKSQAYYGLKQYDNSMKLCEEVLEYDQNNYDSLYGMGMCLYHQNQLHKAMTYFNQIIHNNPLDLKTLKIITKISSTLQLYYQLSDCCDKIIQLGFGDQSIYYYRGLAFMNQKQYQNAIDDFNKSLSYDQNNIIALKNKAICLTQIKDFDQAVLCYDIILKQSKDVQQKQDLYYEKGYCHLLGQQFFSAKTNFDSALQLKPKNDNLILKIANAYRDNNNIQPATNMYDRLIKMKPDNPLYYAEKAQLLDQLGNQKEAKLLYDKAISLQNDNPKFYIQRAKIKIQIQEFDEAIEDLQQAIKLNDQDSEIFFELGQLFYGKQNFEQCIVQLQKAIDINDNVEKYHLKYAQALQMQDFDQEANEYLQSIIVKHADFDNCKNLLENSNVNSFSSREYTNVFVYFMISMFSEGMVDENRSINIVREESLRFLQEKLKSGFPIIPNIFEIITNLMTQKYDYNLIKNQKEIKRILAILYKNKFEQQQQCIMDFIESGRKITKLKENDLRNDDQNINNQLQEIFLQQCSEFQLGQFQSKASALAISDSVALITGILLSYNKLVQTKQPFKNQIYDLIKNGSLSKLKQK
ncbi:unnamed protein product [Paramecium pentaurelia]|uniref:Tetratricopeptide repeat protein 21A/21B N-terminal ARM repeat domain-containing protein n=1 Tax=Paramecium pentaurelia TaxID=43138 RepID=A0A8S1VCM3_9CILI|nr:unnamed protein product [Paramecium pentaurelia]